MPEKEKSEKDEKVANIFARIGKTITPILDEIVFTALAAGAGYLASKFAHRAPATVPEKAKELLKEGKREEAAKVVLETAEEVSKYGFGPQDEGIALRALTDAFGFFEAAEELEKALALTDAIALLDLSTKRGFRLAVAKTSNDPTERAKVIVRLGQTISTTADPARQLQIVHNFLRSTGVLILPEERTTHVAVEEMRRVGQSLAIQSNLHTDQLENEIQATRFCKNLRRQAARTERGIL